MPPWEPEHHLLTTPAGLALLAEVASTPRPGPAQISAWRKHAPAELVVAALRIAEARRKGAAKFADADRLWLEPEGVEQATADPVARHKAARFARFEIVADLCSGIGGDALAIAAAGPRVLALDADPAMPRRLAWNARVRGLEDRLLPVLGRAESSPTHPGLAVHIDPDRRASPTGRRASRMADYAPSLAWLKQLIRSHDLPGGAIKLGPASDFPSAFGADPVEVELISLGGECKEATVWFGALAGCRRRATVLPAGAPWSDLDGSGLARTDGPRSWAYDPDPSLIRAGLVDSFASAHGLGRLIAGVDYLVSDSLIDSPFLRPFEVLAVLPVDLKTIRREVHAHGLGPLEIKVRGLDLRPESLRPKISPPGPLPATLLLAGGRTQSIALLARSPLPL